jgi:dolichol-phosphate mannosyltransferase
MNYDLTLVIPTFNEKANIEPLLHKLAAALDGYRWEVIFVDDDSLDGTAAHIRSIGRTKPHVRCLQRIGRRGLSSACIEGMLAASSDVLAVMDADMQHDERKLDQMYRALLDDDRDVVIGSRYVDGGNLGEWTAARKFISRCATGFSKILLSVEIKDPMSGFFMVRRSFFETTVRRLTGKGFKILLDLCASSPAPVKFVEIPYTFGLRTAGESKLGTLVAWEYILLIADKTIGRLVPVRFVLFVIVGALGAFIHLAILGISVKILGRPFMQGQILATAVAMTTNFFFDNLFTYRDKQLKGKAFFVGLVTFYAACSLGAFMNVRIATFLYDAGIAWFLAGLLGAMVGSVWNYAVTSYLTWHQAGE